MSGIFLLYSYHHICYLFWCLGFCHQFYWLPGIFSIGKLYSMSNLNFDNELILIVYVHTKQQTSLTFKQSCYSKYAKVLFCDTKFKRNFIRNMFFYELRKTFEFYILMNIYCLLYCTTLPPCCKRSHGTERV